VYAPRFPDKILATPQKSGIPGMRQPANPVYAFGDFCLDPSERLLFRKGVPLPLTPKVFDALVLLIENAGHLVEKDEFMKRLWPDTFVGDDTLASNISLLRKALGGTANAQDYIVTVPKRGYRFVAAISEAPQNGSGVVLRVPTSATSAATQASMESRIDAVPAGRQVAPALEPMPPPKTRHSAFYIPWARVLACALIIGVITGAITYRLLRSRQSLRLTGKDTLVLADFTNNTGDSIFDETLKQGLRAQLEQSPFLNAVSDQKVTEELRLMQRSPEERLTPALAREVCEREGSKAVFAGAISSLGTHYVIGLSVLNCHTGDVLASEQVEADSRDHVLRSLSQSTTDMRKKLGESLASIQKYGMPLEQVTTPSLDALKAYSLGMKVRRAKGAAAALPFLQRAVELDPSFAMAHARLAMVYVDLDEVPLTVESERRAYDLRRHVSEHERFYIEANYYGWVTGEFEKEIETYELWRETYPQDLTASNNLADLYGAVGQYEKALQVSLEVLPQQPDNQNIYHEVARNYLFLNRFEEARNILDQAARRGLESENLAVDRYMLAFFEADKPTMEKLLASAGETHVAEDSMLFWAAATTAYHGQCREATILSQRSVEPAKRAGSSSRAATHQVEAAESEALIGCAPAVADAEAALKLAPDTYTEGRAGLALALAGENAHAEKVADDLRTNSPPNTFPRRAILPLIDAAVALNRKKAQKAIEALDVGTATAHDFRLAYLRGQAHLALRDGRTAAGEFERVIQQAGVTGFNPIGALAHLGLARAYSSQGDTAKARAAYQEFLALWKDADPDVPTLQQAKAEYAKSR
jgi:DNA-binding winged helix-turn-helix (wHTH) protein/tetratricopeptide (TPR) repeat protein